MAWFQPCGDGVNGEVARLMREHYPDLVEADVRVGVLFAFAPKGEDGLPTSAAVTHGGYPAAAKVRVVSQRDRVAGLPDAQILVDGDRWAEHSERRQTALLHHELHHLEVVRDDKGVVQTDDANRPKLRLRKHDIQVGVFTDIMKLYADDAIDTAEFKAAVQIAQAAFDFETGGVRQPAWG